MTLILYKEPETTPRIQFKQEWTYMSHFSTVVMAKYYKNKINQMKPDRLQIFMEEVKQNARAVEVQKPV